MRFEIEVDERTIEVKGFGGWLWAQGASGLLAAGRRHSASGVSVVGTPPKTL